MSEYQPKWSDFSIEPPSIEVPEVTKPPSGTSGTGISKDLQGNADILTRLGNGSRWLIEQHSFWLAGNPAAACDEQFYRMMAVWEDLEKKLRDGQGFTRCIFGADEHCPQEAIITCAFCIAEPARAEPLVTQLGFLD